MGTLISNLITLTTSAIHTFTKSCRIGKSNSEISHCVRGSAFDCNSTVPVSTQETHNVNLSKPHEKRLRDELADQLDATPVVVEPSRPYVRGLPATCAVFGGDTEPQVTLYGGVSAENPLASENSLRFCNVERATLLVGSRPRTFCNCVLASGTYSERGS